MKCNLSNIQIYYIKNKGFTKEHNCFNLYYTFVDIWLLHQTKVNSFLAALKGGLIKKDILKGILMKRGGAGF